MGTLRRASKLSLACVCAAGAALGGCGSDDGASSGDGKSGGEATIAYSFAPSELDPALDYTVEGWNAMWLVYMAPLTYRHEEGTRGAELIPGLAEEMPEISSDRKTYTFTFRDGLKYSTGAPLAASDFEHSIKRLLNMESEGSGMFLGIEGAEAYVEAGKADGDITGITNTEDTREVTVKLVEPDATFLNVLATTFAGVVPGDTQFESQTRSPAPGIGQFRIASSRPGREFVLEKNKNFPKIPDVPEAKLDKITIRVIKDQRRQTQDIIRGQVDYAIDAPTADLLPEVRAKYKDRYRENVSNTAYYFWLNTLLPPFDDQKVRQAVHTGLDKTALQRLYGGLLEPTCNFLPPGLMGYEKLDPCPFGDPNAAPDVGKAKQLLKEAGATGAKVTVWGNDGEPTKQVVENFADQLNQLGFKAEPKIVSGEVYDATIGNAKTPDLNAGFFAWSQDFPHPANFMSLVDGATITPTDNLNHSNTDLPEVNTKIDELGKEPVLDKVAGQWAAVDKQVVEHAGVVPYGNKSLVTFMSERMDFDACNVYHPLYQDDFSAFCLK